MFSALAVVALARFSDAIDKLDDPKVVTLNAPLVMLVLSVIIPTIAGRVTQAKSRWTGAILVALNVVAAALTALVVDNGTAVISATTAINALVGALLSQGAYRWVLAPNGVTNNPAANPQGVAKLGPDSGIG